MDLRELKELDFNNFGDWPGVIKGVVILLLCGAVAAAWFLYGTRHRLEILASEKNTEIELRGAFEAKQRRAANLEGYREQLAEMKESFGAMLRQLPDKTEVAALLVDVSQTGLASGLEFELFQPSGEELKDFYAELPIQVRVIGRYHEFGRFISGLAALPRIVTIHDVAISNPRADSGGSGPEDLKLTATVKTYRYLDEEAAK